MEKYLFKKREEYSKYFLWIISMIGWTVILLSGFHIEKVDDFLIFILLVVFLFISEYYPMPIWKGFTSVSFPLVYILYLAYGFPAMSITYAFVILLVYILRRRPLRIILFNPAQLVLSFFASLYMLQLFHPMIERLIEISTVRGITEYLFLLCFFSIFNNAIVDILHLIRPQLYSVKMWKQKTLTELSSAAVSLVYGILLYLLGGLDRGEVDIFSYFSFFSPLVGFSLISSTITRLKREKKRMKALFSMTTELNQMLPTKEWLSTLKKSFNELIKVEASILWIKEEGEWRLRFQDGRTVPGFSVRTVTLEGFEEIRKPTLYTYGKKEDGIATECFEKDLKTFVYSPLVVENEAVGMFIVARSLTKSFEDHEVQSIATLANQLAVNIKTRMLITEKEKRIILEERNRIARDIHDGIAQTLAGAVMKLETAEKKFSKHPIETKKLIEESIKGLRESLKEVRESIYALRPYPTERVGLTTAISNKIEDLRQEYNQAIYFVIRGNEIQLSPMAEKVLFDTFQESIHNSIKHSMASKIDILLCYQTENILLKIKDNGKGFSLFQAMLKARNQPHFGILQMNDAADKINASLQIDSKEGAGTIVTMNIPKMGLEGGDIVDQAYASR
ncbi:hypothetical protein DFO70_11818 [Cytobacillus firmus]|uniref:histidine kinase n=2 Tax=Cytobacillus TaxID=2675230 RepID=A0A366JKY7_CYTFI|nr:MULTISPECIES: sensor histidine kinase [Cytobacillus]RBP87596.1 hypothetical protein DFO70_11818 [Cytobacillus firmus]TDX39422.1 hypothetical protein DFO72_11018 [Cytobacillus oceanisediminis]